MRRLQQVKRRQASAVSKKKPNKPRLQTSVVSQTNHTGLANDKWERQANDAANRIMRGEENAARLLSPAPAAKKKIPNSRGEAITRHFREELENDFNADLQAVRIHRDARAWNESRQEKARAFTSGSHIYFSQKAYDPESEKGFMLLAHEVSHVLQQTGRPASNRRLRATDINGSGEIQRDWDYNELFRTYRRHFQVSDELGPTTIGISQEEQSASFNRVENAIREVIGLELRLTVEQGTSRETEDLVDDVENGTYDNEVPGAKSLLFDVLKMWRRFDGAAYLIDHDPNIVTRYYPNDDFLNHFKESDEYGIQSIQNLMESEHPDFHRIWPYNLTTHLWHFLTQFDFPIREKTNGYPDSEDSIWEVYRAHEETFIANELMLLAKDNMFKADQLRYNKITQALDQYDESLEHGDPQIESLWPKKYVAEQLAQSFRTPAEDENVLIRRARLGMRQIAVNAKDYWEQVFRLGSQIEAGLTSRRLRLLLDVENLDQLSPPPDYDFPNDPVLEDLVDVVEQQTRQLYYPSDEGADIVTILNQQQYAEAVNAFQEALEPFLERISDRIGQVYIFGNRDNPEVASLAQWLGWAQVWVFLLIANLTENYDAEGDAVAPNDDIRRRHRLRVARFLHEFGNVTGNQMIFNTAEVVFRGSDVGKSYILLTNQWQVTSRNVNDMIDDFSRTHLIEGWGINIEQLVLFYHILYQTNIAEQLISTFHESPGESDEDSDVEHQESIRQLRQNYNRAINRERTQRLFPKKYINEGAVINYYSGDRETTTLKDLLLRNSVFNQFLQDKTNNQTHRGIIPHGRARRFYIWILPELQELYDELHDIDILQDLVPDEITDPHEWFVTLNRNMLEMSEEERSEFTTQLRDIYREQSIETFAWRRRNYTEEVRSRLIIAARHRGEIDHYTDMTDALSVIQEFSFHIRPVDTTEPQMTLMMLDLADQLNHALLDEPNWFENLLGIGTRVDTRYNVVTGYYGLINHALEFMASGEARTQINNVVVVDITRQPSETTEQYQQRVQQEKDNRVSQLWTKQPVLQTINEQLDRAIREIQLRGIGFEARRGEGVRSFNYASTVPLLQEMRYQGKTFIIDEIFTNFNYFPPYGSETEAQHDSILFRVSGSDQSQMDRESSTRLLRYTEDGEEHLVRANSDDDHHLELLSHVIEEAAFTQSMEQLAETIESAAELTMDVIELVPGFGQGFMVARMGVEITRFVAEDLPELIDALNNPEEMFNQLRDWFEEGDWLENMLEYVMFEADTFNLPSSLTSDTEDEGRSRRRRHRGLDRIIHAMKTLGEKVFYAFQLLQRNVRSGIVRAQLRLIEYRTLMRILEILPGLALTAADLLRLARDWTREHDVDLTPSELLSDLTSEGGIENQIQETFTQIVQGLHSLELPENIIPNESLVDVLLGFALDRFGRKGKLLNDFLQAIGARQELADQISEHLVEGTNIDINLHWRTHFRQPLQAKLISMQDFVINQGLNPLIRETLGNRYVVDLSQIGEPSIGQSSSEEPEVQPYLKEDSELEEDFRWVGQTMGTPLSRTQKSTLEHQFGHDLSHVRIHNDEESQRLTEFSGSYALTSGSHIFLSPDVQLYNQKGQHILRHEISHVLQQTGERPLSEKHDDNPKTGQLGRGLRIDQTRENAAERMANQAEKVQGSVPIEEEGGEGLYPTPRSFILQLLNKLSETQLSEQVTEDMQDRIPRLSGEERRSFNATKSEARGIWRAVNRKVGSGESGINFDAPFGRGRSLIAAALNTIYDRDAGRAIDALTYRSVRQLPSGQFRLRVGRFLNQLETFIYGQTGIVISLSESGDTVGRIRVTYIHLGNTATNFSIWTERSNGVKHNTEANSTAEENDVLSRNWPRIQEYIRSLQYESRHVWDRTEFRLHNEFVDEVYEHFREVAADEVEFGDWENYTNPTLQGNERRVGLRVATHGQLTSRARSTPPPPAPQEEQRRGPDIHEAAKEGRESHHIPQYLLVEYFRNEASTSLFPTNNRLPHFEPTSNRINEFNGGSGQQIDLDRLDPGGTSSRGLYIPAVSLAARTHQRGTLHVNQSSEWSKDLEFENNDTGTLTQSLWLDHYFYTQLDNETRTSGQGTSTTSDKNSIIDRVQAMDPADSKEAIYQAMKASYSVMRRNMLAMLVPALERYEASYYRDIAMAHSDHTMQNEELKREYRPINSSFSDIKSAVEQQNDTNMHQWI